ncbi:MAG: hypothetical protein WKF47_06315 [Geodermatophilaceae bacterium]
MIGNYELDQQQSMQRFGSMMLDGLRAAGIAAEMIKPQPVFGNFRAAGHLAAKWLGYIDKFLIFPFRLKAKLAGRPAIVHISDHSNAVYTRCIRHAPVVVTRHDLLAVRGGLGEATDSPASCSGRWLQRWILLGLQRATAIACASGATLHDAERLLAGKSPAPQLSLIGLGLNHPYRRITEEEATERLMPVAGLSRSRRIHSACRLEFAPQESRRRAPNLCQVQASLGGSTRVRRRRSQRGIAHAGAPTRHLRRRHRDRRSV